MDPLRLSSQAGRGMTNRKIKFARRLSLGKATQRHAEGVIEHGRGITHRVNWLGVTFLMRGSGLAAIAWMWSVCPQGTRMNKVACS
ncbi:hypothetical protein KPLM21_710024 [Klebsiella pneumoniae]|nr:hypothetical protein KPLM21_710024 [Klebsiella pneumoniae]